MAAPLLSVSGLSVDFLTPRGRLHVLRDVDFEVPANCIVGVVGESGCGKSTLASALIGLLPGNADITAGTIAFGGEDLVSAPPRRLRALRGTRISMIFQDPMTSLNPVATIGWQMIQIQYRDRISMAEKRRNAAQMLAKVGIPDPEERMNSYPHQFSGGMRQRVCIAMALLTRPDLLIADEPTTALDATLEVQIIHLLRDLQREFGCSIVFVSHHLGTVAELCDEVAVMYAGELFERGDIRDVFHTPAHPYTKALFECDPGQIKQVTRNLPTIPGNVPGLYDIPPGCIFRDRCALAFADCATDHPALLPGTGAGQIARCHLLRERAEA